MMHRSFLAVVLCLCYGTSPALRAEEQFFDSNGVKIHYTVQGEGEPVLLIHGFPVNIQTQWDLPGITKGLSKGDRVIALDNRGHGQSRTPHDVKKDGQDVGDDAVRPLA